MNCVEFNAQGRPKSISDAARRRMLAVRGEPLFYADWLRAVFIHFPPPPPGGGGEVDADINICSGRRRLNWDLRDGQAFVSLVAFTMRGMRPRIGGRLGALLFKPIATHEFLNVRTYVKHRGETGHLFSGGMACEFVERVAGTAIVRAALSVGAVQL